MKKINIAIDGPSAAGKSTIAKRLAVVLGYVHMDTGAMYRCCAWKAKQLGIDAANEDEIVSMLKQTNIVLKTDGTVWCDGTDVSQAIRHNDISLLTSAISQHPRVRAELVVRQQAMAKDKGFILDGRDIGSVVLPDAELKIYQIASVQTRARRRYHELLESGCDVSLANIEIDIMRRDKQDMTRASSPLVQVADAVLLDTSDMTIEEAVNTIVSLVNERVYQANMEGGQM